MYTYQTKIKLHETDAAGILFFSHQFKMVHDAYEGLLEKIGFGFAELIRNKDFFLPIVHAEADFKMPLFVGDLIEIQVTFSHIGQTSLTLSYKLLNLKQELVGTAKTVHVTINKETRQKIPIPREMREKIEELLREDQALSKG